VIQPDYLIRKVLKSEAVRESNIAVVL